MFVGVNKGKRVQLCFWFCWQQLEQLQKELNFLEEDIKRVEVGKLTKRSPKMDYCALIHMFSCENTGEQNA